MTTIVSTQEEVKSLLRQVEADDTTIAAIAKRWKAYDMTALRNAAYQAGADPEEVGAYARRSTNDIAGIAAAVQELAAQLSDLRYHLSLISDVTPQNRRHQP